MKRTTLPLPVYAEAFVTLLSDVPMGEARRLVQPFVRLLARHRVLHRADRILEDIERLLIEKEGFLRADVHIASTLGAERLLVIERLLETVIGQPVKAVVSVDDSLIAGFRAQVEDLVVDASLRGSLTRLHAHLLRP
jgi:F-type H+-transporting ATPase subunit delta